MMAFVKSLTKYLFFYCLSVEAILGWGNNILCYIIVIIQET
jgi:hypothetical protein